MSNAGEHVVQSFVNFCNIIQDHAANRVLSEVLCVSNHLERIADTVIEFCDAVQFRGNVRPSLADRSQAKPHQVSSREADNRGTNGGYGYVMRQDVAE